VIFRAWPCSWPGYGRCRSCADGLCAHVDESDEDDEELEDSSEGEDDVTLVNVVDPLTEAGDVDSDDENEGVKHSHKGVVGAAALTDDSASLPEEFMVRYFCECSQCPGPGASVQEECFLLELADFDTLENPPSVARKDLGWDERAIKRRMVFLYGKLGYTGWYSGTIVGYDLASTQHTIKPLDGTGVFTIDLLKCKKTIVKEWRFLFNGEDPAVVCAELNSNA
jgi:hypothetical protein